MANKNTNKPEETKTQEKGNFFQNLFSSLFKTSNPEADKKRKLKNIAKSFSKTKYHSFYKPGSQEIMFPLAKLIYDLYKVVSPAQIYFRSIQNPMQSKRMIMNYCLSEHQLELLDHFDEQKILEMSKKVPIQKISATLEKELQEFTSEFEGEKAVKIENLYKSFCLFRDFCSYDFYVFLKKFDSSFVEYQFNTQPRLDKITSDYVIDDLKDFIDVAFAITDDTIIWQDLFEMFKTTTGKEMVSFNNWRKIVAKIKAIQLSKAFDYMLQLMSQDPNYQIQLNYHFDSLLEPYTESIQNDTHNILNKISSQQKESKTNEICMQIFGTASPQSMTYYVPGFNAVLEKKDLDPIIYAEPLNFLKTFLVEYVKKQIREYYDVVVIRGQWDSSLSAPLSNAYQELLKISDEITVFDEAFSEDGPMGMKIKTLLPKTAHDSGAENIINRVVSDANDQAKGYIYTGTQDLITIGKTIKQLIEDYVLPKPVIVQNWKELEKYIEEPMKEYCVAIYKKIYLFVQLMQQYLQN